VTGFAGVFAVVLVEVVAGASILTWASPLWTETKRSYFTIWSVIMALLFAWPAWLSARAGTVSGDTAATSATALTLLTALVMSLAALAFLARWQGVGRAMGVAATVIALVTLVSFARLGRQDDPVSLFQLLTGAAFLGAAYDALFLGHWYLTDRKLSRAPINRYTNALIATTCVEFIAIATGGFAATASSRSFNPLLTTGALAPWIAIGMAACTLLIGVLARAALRGERASAVQSATGFFYLSFITALVAQIAVTTRYFPG
jgi:hypothetical protein